MIVAAPLANGVLGEKAPAGERLARIENLGRGAGDRIDETACKGRDAAELLDEVEGSPLAGQEQIHRAFDGRNYGPAGDGISIVHFSFDPKLRREMAEHQLHRGQAGDNARGTG